MHPVHAASHTNIGIAVLSGAFGILVAVLLMAGFFLICFFIVNFLTRLIQSVFPTFMTPKRTLEQGESPAEAREANRKIAYDWILEQARQRRQEVANVSQAEFGRFKNLVEARLQGKTAIGVGEVTTEDKKENEWDLNLLNRAIPIETKKINRSDNELRDKAQFSLVTFPEGPKGPPRYLCMKLNSASSASGKGLRVAFADLPQMAIRLDHVSAHRLANMIPNTFVAPINAAARRWIRNTEPLRVKEELHATAKG
jgi:hypothetical protein